MRKVQDSVALIHEQDTLPLPRIDLPMRDRKMIQEAQSRYRWLKALSDASGVRLLFVYLWLERGQQMREHFTVSQLTRALYHLTTGGAQ